MPQGVAVGSQSAVTYRLEWAGYLPRRDGNRQGTIHRINVDVIRHRMQYEEAFDWHRQGGHSG